MEFSFRVFVSIRLVVYFVVLRVRVLYTENSKFFVFVFSRVF